MTEVIHHLSVFISRLWQIYVFGEGNTRTTTVFFIEYLRQLGFEVDFRFHLTAEAADLLSKFLTANGQTAKNVDMLLDTILQTYSGRWTISLALA